MYMRGPMCGGCAGVIVAHELSDGDEMLGGVVGRDGGGESGGGKVR